MKEKIMKEKKSANINDQVFEQLYSKSSENPVMNQNFAECITLASIISDVEISEEIIYETVINEEGDIVKRQKVDIQERYIIDEKTGKPVLDEEGNPKTEFVTIPQMKTILKNVKLVENEFKEVAKILQPILSGKTKSSFMATLGQIEIQKLKTEDNSQRKK